MSAYRSYPKYKPSGVETLGDVPEGWVVCAPKRRMKSAAGGTLIKGTCSDEPSDGLFPGFSASGQNVWLEEYNYDCPAIVLSAVGARCGKAFKADGKWGVVANTHCLFPLRDSDRDYLWYMTNQEDWWEKGGSAQPFVKVSETLSRPWVFPPLAEQHQIAAFLERVCGKLDALQAKQERLIELLKEKRQALISHAVTRGLDPTAKLKPSGIEWLGEVPEHWVAPYFGMLIAKAELGGNYDGSEGGDGIPLIKMGNLDRGFVKTHKVEYLPEGQAYDRAFVLKDGDFLFNTRNSLDLVGKVAVWRNELPLAIYNSNILRIAFRKQKVADSAFMSYFFNSDLGVSQLRLVAKGTTSVAAIYYKDLTTLRITLPPLAEQRAIVAHLEEKCGKIDQLKAKAERGIELLKERRSALISAAVTGKIDVRNV